MILRYVWHRATRNFQCQWRTFFFTCYPDFFRFSHWINRWIILTSYLLLPDQVRSTWDVLQGTKNQYNLISILIHFAALLIFDDVYPTVLSGKKSNGQIVQLSICPEDIDFIQLTFDENQVWNSRVSFQYFLDYSYPF